MFRAVNLSQFAPPCARVEFSEDALSTCGAKARCKGRIVQHTVEGLRERSGITRWNEQARFFMLDCLGNSANTARDYRYAHRHGLEHDARETLVVRRYRKHVDGGEKPGNVGGGQAPEHGDRHATQGGLTIELRAHRPVPGDCQPYRML